jgi:hypothetical protein
MITAPISVTRQILPCRAADFAHGFERATARSLPIRAKPLSSGGKVIGRLGQALATKRKRHAEDG